MFINVRTKVDSLDVSTKFSLVWRELDVIIQIEKVEIVFKDFLSV